MSAVIVADSRMAPRYPVYVQSLRQESAEACAEVAALWEGIADLEHYLASSKFREWPYVNVADVFQRLRETRSAALAATTAADANQPGGFAA